MPQPQPTSPGVVGPYPTPTPAPAPLPRSQQYLARMGFLPPAASPMMQIGREQRLAEVQARDPSFQYAAQPQSFMPTTPQERFINAGAGVAEAVSPAIQAAASPLMPYFTPDAAGELPLTGEIASGVTRGATSMGANILSLGAMATNQFPILGPAMETAANAAQAAAKDVAATLPKSASADSFLSPRFYIAGLSELAPQLALQAGMVSKVGQAAGMVQRALAWASPAALADAGGAYDEARTRWLQKGVSEDHAENAATVEGLVYGTGSALLESIGGAGVLGKLPQEMRDKILKSVARRVLAKGALGMTSEGLTEAAQEAWNDITSVMVGSQTAAEAFQGAGRRYFGAGLLGGIAGTGAGMVDAMGATPQDTLAREDVRNQQKRVLGKTVPVMPVHLQGHPTQPVEGQVALSPDTTPAPEAAFSAPDSKVLPGPQVLQSPSVTTETVPHPGAGSLKQQLIVEGAQPAQSAQPAAVPIEGEPDAGQNIQGLPSKVGVGEEPQQAGPVQGESPAAPAPSGVIQAQEEMTLDEALDIRRADWPEKEAWFEKRYGRPPATVSEFYDAISKEIILKPAWSDARLESLKIRPPKTLDELDRGSHYNSETGDIVAANPKDAMHEYAHYLEDQHPELRATFDTEYEQKTGVTERELHTKPILGDKPMSQSLYESVPREAFAQVVAKHLSGRDISKNYPKTYAALERISPKSVATPPVPSPAGRTAKATPSSEPPPAAPPTGTPPAPPSPLPPPDDSPRRSARNADMRRLVQRVTQHLPPHDPGRKAWAVTMAEADSAGLLNPQSAIDIADRVTTELKRGKLPIINTIETASLTAEAIRIEDEAKVLNNKEGQSDTDRDRVAVLEERLGKIQLALAYGGTELGRSLSFRKFSTFDPSSPAAAVNRAEAVAKKPLSPERKAKIRRLAKELGEKQAKAAETAKKAARVKAEKASRAKVEKRVKEKDILHKKMTPEQRVKALKDFKERRDDQARRLQEFLTRCNLTGNNKGE